MNNLKDFSFRIDEIQYKEIEKISALFTSMTETFSFMLMKKVLKEFKQIIYEKENPRVNFENLSGNDLLIQKIKSGLIQTRIAGEMI